jgi:hypothetical protein
MQHEAAPEQAAMVEHHREHQMLRSTPSTLRRLMIFAASTVVRSAKRKTSHRALGLPGCWRASHQWSSLSPSPTRMPALPGRSRREAVCIELQPSHSWPAEMRLPAG